MPNDDLISRKDLLFEISTKATVYDGSRIGKGIGVLLNKSEVLGRIEDAPSVDAEPVKHGKWRQSRFLNGKIDLWPPTYECSECHYILFGSPRTNYCPNCGAKMDKEE